MSKKSSISLVIIVAIVCSILSSLLTVVVVSKTDILKNTTTTATKGPNSQIVVNNDGKSTNVYQAVSQKAMPSVVGITTTTVSSNYFSMPVEATGVGTGIVVDSEGYILTNSHVISDGSARTVSVLFNDGATVDGEVYWYDQQLDLAIVKVEKTGLTVAELGDSDEVSIGDISIAIGNPYGLDLASTVTQGIISGLDRTISTEETTMTGLMQTDASINSGNSGGPLLNSSGHVIGINTAKASEGEGLGFAIPINTAKPIIESIIETGKYEKVTLGIKGIDASSYMKYSNQKLSTDSGVYVSEVIGGSAAQRAGIQSGDIILSIDGIKLSVLSDLTKNLYNYTVGDTAQLVINRNGQEITLDVTF